MLRIILSEVLLEILKISFSSTRTLLVFCASECTRFIKMPRAAGCTTFSASFFTASKQHQSGVSVDQVLWSAARSHTSTVRTEWPHGYVEDMGLSSQGNDIWLFFFFFFFCCFCFFFFFFFEAHFNVESISDLLELMHKKVRNLEHAETM